LNKALPLEDFHLYHFVSSAIYFCVQEGELDAVAVVHSYEDGMPAGSHKTRLIALNVCLLLPKFSEIHPLPQGYLAE
jgi:hypothetical protein